MKNTNKISWLAIIVTVAALVFATAFSGSAVQKSVADIEKGCNTHNLAGTYPYSAFGTIHPDHPLGYPPGPYTSAGIVKLGPDGTYQLSAKTSLNGNIISESVSDEYTIGENCEVTLMFMGTPYTVTYTSEDREHLYGVVLVPKSNVAIVGAGK